MRKVNSLTSVIAIATMFLSGCSLLPGEKSFDELADGPGRILQPEEVIDAVPTDEPFADLGNKSPYSVNGRFYYVMEDPTHYRARGVASWYGKKFHGRKTSSGEVFDMYSMTAAHRNLPLPTYLEVTNLDNGQVAIVRVNDRGPFVDDRLIDLSYAAAIKLGLADTGTANVEVRAITGDEIAGAQQMAEASSAEVRESEGVEADAVMASATAGADAAAETATEQVEDTTESVAQAADEAVDNAADTTAQSGSASASAAETVAAADMRLLQLGAFSRQAGAESVREQALAAVPGSSVQVLKADRNGNALYRVRLGPIATANIDAAKASLATAGLGQVAVLPVGTDGGECVAGCQ